MHKYIENLKKDWTLIVKGIKLVHKLQPFLILVAIIGGLFLSVYPFIGLYYSSQIITELSNARDWNKIIQYAILTVVLTCLCSILNQFFGQMLDILQYVLGHKLELHITDKCYQLDYAAMEDSSIREIKEKLRKGSIRQIIYQLYSFIQNIISLILSIALVIQMFSSKSDGTSKIAQFLNSPLTVIGIAILFVIAIFYMSKANGIIQKKRFEVIHNERRCYKYVYFYAYELSTEYNCGKDVRLYHQIPLIEKELKDFLGTIISEEKKLRHVNNFYSSTSVTLRGIITVFTYLFVGLKALTNAISVGNIVLYSGAVTQFGNAFSNMGHIIIQLKRNSEYLQWFFDFMDLPNHKETGTKRLDLEEAKNYEIEFRNVSFHYPSSEAYSLKNINLTFKVGERLAIVGKNGSGKTTFIKLLCRLYDPQEGEILLNGINIKEYDYYDYLSLFSVVFQDFHLFSFTIGENVAAASDYDEQKVEDCVFKSGLENRMERFPNGIKTQIYNEFAEDGVEISGGEAQKIAIARALYKDAPFIILDEPTAALDPLAEADIYSRLNDLIKNKTAVYISHRLSSCYFCNQIAVFDEAYLVQYGTHKELLEKTDKLYYELWNSQAQYYQ